MLDLSRSVVAACYCPIFRVDKTGVQVCRLLSSLQIGYQAPKGSLLLPTVFSRSDSRTETMKIV